MFVCGRGRVCNTVWFEKLCLSTVMHRVLRPHPGIFPGVIQGGTVIEGDTDRLLISWKRVWHQWPTIPFLSCRRLRCGQLFKTAVLDITVRIIMFTRMYLLMGWIFVCWFPFEINCFCWGKHKTNNCGEDNRKQLQINARTKCIMFRGRYFQANFLVLFWVWCSNCSNGKFLNDISCEGLTLECDIGR